MRAGAADLPICRSHTGSSEDFIALLIARSHAIHESVRPRAVPVLIDGESHSVVGIMPNGFEYPQRVRLWLPARLNPARTIAGLWLIGRFEEWSDS